MSTFKSQVKPLSERFLNNRVGMLKLVKQLRDLETRAIKASNKRRSIFEKRGQIAPHDRIAHLLDPGMPFLRLHTLSNYLFEDSNPETSIPGASVICGIGFIKGVRCMIWVDDSGIRAGSYTPTTVSTGLSIQSIARRQKLPLVHLVESAGANLMEFTVENWVEAGALFRNLAQLSAAGIPSLTVLHGPSTAGGAYMPGLSDFVVGVKENGLAALGGVALVHSATGEVAKERELGGSEMHANVSGLVEYLAENDAHGLSIARDIIGRLQWNKNLHLPHRIATKEPLLSSEELVGIVSINYKDPFDIREVITRIVDASEFDEFKPRYGCATICLHASIMGFSCGIIANNGPIDPFGATKAAQFFQLCDQTELPLIFLHNTTGYLVGTESERAGMIKHGAKMIQAVSNIRIPKISMIIGASFGAGNYGMCGAAYEPDFLFAWPNAATNVMGGEQAAKTMTQVAESIATRKGKKVDRSALVKQEKFITDYFIRQQDAFYTAGRNLVHSVIDPRDSRRVLGFALETCSEAAIRKCQANSYGVARF
ncbi:acyl-CoA carboxylase subunit beta [Microbulbifer sp. 2205BS26-8]|uniref:acyl-CoA carboxylase subunit beta n=1 Tax=Microbulbifer sp. 2205BS26-8 TaxID=3064386 RepID=UPI00274008FD|nr:carboxyl transferase domain-containing protein [Microbulbifer sp. 2205BS26-8]MDP5209278.1 carboxyl transferase domain-containing protein [Microbulbifer sp. 2205BS26-8]